MLLAGDGFDELEAHALSLCAPECLKCALVSEDGENKPEEAAAASLVEFLGACWPSRDGAADAIVDTRSIEAICDVSVPIVHQAKTIDLSAEIFKLFAGLIIEVVFDWAHSMNDICFFDADRVAVFLS